MKAVQINNFGGPQEITTGEAALNDLQPGEVLVRVEAASVNPLDLKMLAGYMQEFFPIAFPYIPGTDFSGLVESVGSDVTSLKPGDQVVGRTTPNLGGAFAQKLVIGASSLVTIPKGMTFEQAAALPTSFGTASKALFEVGNLTKAQRVLIHAGAGGVGSMAVQQAHHAGAYVIATASRKNMELVKRLGADEVIDYHIQDFTQQRDIDLVLDTVGGETLEKSWMVLRPGGRIASLVEFGIQPKGEQAGDFVFFSEAEKPLRTAMRMFSQGQLQIVIDSIFPIAEARAALEKVAAGHARGKVLLRLSN